MPTYTSGPAAPAPRGTKQAQHAPMQGFPGLNLGATTAPVSPNARDTTSQYSMGVRMPTGGVGAFSQPQTGPMQAPGNNMTNPGYGEQAFEYTQNRLLNDPSQGLLQDQYNQSQNPSAGEAYLNQNLGSLDGPGSGEQYWNQVSGQFAQPFSGENFARQATQQMGASGPASAFYNQAMGQYGDMTNYSGPGNTQGQYGQSSASLANGTAGERGLGQIAGQYGSIGQYNGPNNAAGQYQQNASSGPLAGQQYYDSVQGQQATKGTYSDPNLAAGQYAQTQQAFGDLPIANFDPFYDRARQLATQDYNRQSAGRGVYGSSEALSGVGNVITDIEAQRANRSFDAEMQRSVEQRNRQQLLGEQARQGDLSSLSAFGANLAGLETFGNLANQAGNQTLGQQTMLGNQARNADVSATDAFNANLNGASTFANINNMQANQELGRNELLGNMANAADSQALGAHNSNIAGLNAFGNLASSADSAETNRFTARTGAMNNADRTAIDRMTTGANIANNVDANNRANYSAQASAAGQAAGLTDARTRTGADIANTLGQNDLARLNSFNSTAQGAEAQRQARQVAKMDSMRGMTAQVVSTVTNGLAQFQASGQTDFENWFNADMAKSLQAAGLDQQQIDGIRQDMAAAANLATKKT